MFKLLNVSLTGNEWSCNNVISNMWYFSFKPEWHDGSFWRLFKWVFAHELFFATIPWHLFSFLIYLCIQTQLCILRVFLLLLLLGSIFICFYLYLIYITNCLYLLYSWMIINLEAFKLSVSPLYNALHCNDVQAWKFLV